MHNLAHLRDGKLIAMEGDYDHIVNRGSLCVKGISMFATHTSPNRLATPRYRAPGSDYWEEISWGSVVDRIAQKICMTRDATWIATLVRSHHAASDSAWLIQQREELVDHQVKIELARNTSLQATQEGQELLMAMAGLALGKHRARGNIERSEEGGGANGGRSRG